MDKNFLAMSDEDIMNMTAPPASDDAGDKTVEEQQTPAVEESSANTSNDPTDSEPKNKEAEPEATDANQPADDEGKAYEQGDEGTEADDKDESKPGDEAAAGKEEGAEAEAKGGNEGKGKEASEAGAKEAAKPNADAAKPTDVKDESTTPPNYEEMYNKIMAPFKANGKEITLKSPEEAVGLMQMGANYTKKMQELQPFRKILMMLQNNDLIDENKLSFLIDIEKKNPDAIHKLIKDSGVDPLTLDTESETTYLEGNHKVSNNEVKFASTVESVGSTDSGKETLNVMKTWDDTSKELLWEHPEVMAIIHQQRETGVFQTIDAEVDRQRALGQIGPETPYLEAYKIAGDHLQKTGGLPTGEPVKETTTEQPPKKEPVVLEERAVAPKPKVNNGEQANAAAPARSSQQKVETKKNPLAMSDDEFMKQFDGRL